MKFIHTSDWHLGKTFFEQPLLEDQQFFLEQLKDILKNDSYDALIISGDIYDRAVPPAESVTLLSNFLSDVRKISPCTHIIISSGNHDSPERLSFAKNILNMENIHIITDTKNFAEPIIIDDTALYILPWLNPGVISIDDENEKILRSQEELLSAAIKIIEDTHKKSSWNNKIPILSAHLFTAGVLTSDSERFVQGTAEQIDAKLLDFFEYAALGHIHSMQKVGKNSWYSGSPLAYSFNENKNEKFIITGHSENQKILIQPVEIKPLHPVVTIEDSFAEISGKKYSEYKNCFIHAVCTDSSLIINPMQILRKNFPYILSFTYKRTEAADKQSVLSERKNLISNNSADYEKIYTAFMNDIYGKDCKISTEEKELFKSYAKQSENAE